jgi:integrase
MTKTTRNRLSDIEIRKAARPFAKALADGGNLYLDQMPTTGSLKWKVVYKLRGKKATIWLEHPYPKLSLKDARRRRDEIEDQASKGIDPKVARKAGTTPAGMSFRAFIEKHGEDLAPPAARGRREWLHAMKTKVGALADMELGAITGDHVADALKPIWLTKPPTAKKRLSGIATVLRAARARGLIDTVGWTNPASYRDSFSGVMKKPVHIEAPREAMAYADVPAFIADLRARSGPLAMALELIILSGVRVSEALGATWAEVDREARVWTIPATRMKGATGLKREHAVPLTAPMLDVLDRAMPKGGAGPTSYIFPSRVHGAGCFAKDDPLDLLRELRPGSLTVHGFRSSFFDWSQEVSDYSDRLVNSALAHVVKDRVQRAYDRSALIERRRPLMEAWTTYVTTPVLAANSDTREEIAEAA